MVGIAISVLLKTAQDLSLLTGFAYSTVGKTGRIIVIEVVLFSTFNINATGINCTHVLKLIRHLSNISTHF